MNYLPTSSRNLGPSSSFFPSFITDDIMQESLTKFMLEDESSSDEFPFKNCKSLPFNNTSENIYFL